MTVLDAAFVGVNVLVQPDARVVVVHAALAVPPVEKGVVAVAQDNAVALSVVSNASSKASTVIVG